MLASLAVDMIGFAIGVIATLTFNRTRATLRERRPAMRLLQLDLDRPIWIVIAAGRDRNGTEMTDLVFPAEAKAAAELESFLRSLKPDVQVRVAISGAVPTDALRDNLIVIGGPVNNEIARRIAEEVTDESSHVFEGYTLVTPDGRRFDAEVREGRVVRDFALVRMGENPFAAGGTLIWIAGCRTYGCLAGARALIRTDVRQTLAATKGTWPVALVVSGIVEQGEVFRARVEDVMELAPSS